MIHPSPLWKRGAGIDEYRGSPLISLSGLFVFPGASGPDSSEGGAKFFQLLKRVQVKNDPSNKYSYDDVS